MAACDAFTLASKWEGLPVAVMEAIALGLPIVATNVGGMAAELTDGIDALLAASDDSVALADAIEQLATDDMLRSRLAEAASSRAVEFDVERTVAALESAYRSIARVPIETLAPAATSSNRRSSTLPTPEVRPATPDDRSQIIELLQRSLGSDGNPRYPELFAWKHDHNRFGPSPMWVATDAGRVVAFRALMRWEFVRGGQVLRAVRAVDTATDPEFQGRGLFKALTMHGVEAMREDGVDFVFNTPNDQSRPGYLKMGWREVGRLPAAVRFTGPSGAMRALRSRVPADRWSTELDVGVSIEDWLEAGGVGDRLPEPTDVREIRTNIDDEFLAWRFGGDLLGYRVVDDGDSAVIARARMRGASKELAIVAEFGGPDRDAAARSKVQRSRRVAAMRSGSAARTRPPAMSDCLVVARPSRGEPVNDEGFPPLANWAMSLGDIELF